MWKMEMLKLETLQGHLDSFGRFNTLLDFGGDATTVALERRRLHPCCFRVMRVGVDRLG